MIDRCRHAQAARGHGIAGGGAQRCPVGADAVFNDGAAHRGRKMRHRFGNTEKHQADAHARRKQHREPADITVVGSGILAAETNPAKWRHDQENGEQDEDVAGTDEKPVKRGCQKWPQPAEKLCCSLLKHQRDNDKGNNRKSGNQENRIVYIKSERGDVVPADLVVDRFVINRLGCITHV